MKKSFFIRKAYFLLVFNIIIIINICAQNCHDLSSNPYTMGFEEEETNEFKKWKIKDFNYDGKKWNKFYYEDAHSGVGYIEVSLYNYDWAVTQCFTLKANTDYVVSFWYDNQYNTLSNQNLCFNLGKWEYDTSLSDTTFHSIDTIINLENICAYYTQVSKVFRVDTEGDYRLGFFAYGTTRYQDTYMRIDDFELKEFACTASVDLGTDDTICAGSSRTLDAGTDFATYLWKKDGVQVGTERYLTVDTSGTYKVEVKDQFDCETNDEINISLFSYPETMSCLVYQNGKDTLINSLSVCDKQTVVLVSGLNAAYKAVCDIKWYEEDSYSPISTGDTLRVTTPGVYYYKALHKTLGCEQQSDNSVVIDVKYPYEEQRIERVSIDENTGKNIIYWFDSNINNVAKYNIYKESNTAGLYIKVGNVNKSGTGYSFVDTTSKPAARSNRYKISITDSCNNESVLSDYHKTIYLAISVGIENKYNLNWEKYEGLEYDTYVINRATGDSTHFVTIDSIPSSLNSFTDLNPDDNNTNYYIVGIYSRLNKSNKGTGKILSLSNVVSSKTVGISKQEMSIADMKIYPNPVSEMLNVEFLMLNEGKVDIRLLDITGREIAMILDEERATGKNNVTFNIGNIDKGIYFMKVSAGGSIVTRKIVKN
ncbi:MAG: T9SS type A sorting domain-containing protein [Bacteroidales bacterium]|nr:T9SS type A sorting domain-containing protein [Bacteroidales bacterium]